MGVTALCLVSSCTFVHDSFQLRLSPSFFFFVFGHKKWEFLGSASCPLARWCMTLPVAPLSLVLFLFVFGHKKWEFLGSTSCPLARWCMTLSSCVFLPFFPCFSFLDIKNGSDCAQPVTSCTYVHNSPQLRLSPLFCFLFLDIKKWELQGSNL